MPELQPFTGHLVAPGSAREVVAPPYDSLTIRQREAMAAADPDSFLNVLPAAGHVAADELEHTLRACRRSVERLVAGGRFVPLAEPAIAIVAIGSGADRALAVVGDLPASAFEVTAGQDHVRPHERTDATRVDQLARYLEVVGVASSPVAVTHRPDAEVARATGTIVATPPQLAFRGDDGVDIAVWAVTGTAARDRLSEVVAGAGPLYVADGHHRAAAVMAYASRHGAGPDEAAGRVLTAVIPSDHLHVAPFHRRIVVPSPPSPDAVLEHLRARGLDPQLRSGPAAPETAGTVSVAVGGRWWSIDLRARRAGGAVESLDVRLAEREIVAPLLDPAGGPAAGGRVEPVAAPAGLGALVDDRSIGVALAAPDIDAVLAVADRGLTMPPKTTYVTPKLRSGLVLTSRRTSDAGRGAAPLGSAP